jgi:hypothetical protein
VVRVAARLEAVDRNARDSLQRLGDGTIRQSTNIFGGHRVNDDVRILLQGLGRLQTAAHTTSNDLLDNLRLIAVCVDGLLRQRAGLPGDSASRH